MSVVATNGQADRAALIAAARGEVRPRTEPVPMGIRYINGPGAPARGPATPAQSAEDAPTARVEAGTTPAGLTLGDLLAKASASSHARTKALGEKVTALLADLATRVNTEAAERQIEAEIADLEHQLADKRNQLRKARRPDQPTTTDSVGAAPQARIEIRPAPVLDPKAIRDWARDNDVECNAHGRVPQRVVDAWRAATSGGDAR